jgi:3-phenylpropionate/cinnamic acid dioxygenase small subunit
MSIDLRSLRAAESAIADVLYAYSECADHRLTDGWSACFTPDASVILRLPGDRRPPIVHTGLAAIAHAFESVRVDAMTLHVVTNVSIALSADDGEADVRSSFARVDTRGRLNRVLSYGRYRDQAMCCDDGQWRLTARVIELVARSRWP